VSALEKAVESASSSGVLVTLYRGERVNDATAKEAAARLDAALPDCEIELIDGGQPYYDFLFSVE
jgi:dihydroxyacetone kinase-like predicted kinase